MFNLSTFLCCGGCVCKLRNVHSLLPYRYCGHWWFKLTVSHNKFVTNLYHPCVELPLLQFMLQQSLDDFPESNNLQVSTFFIRVFSFASFYDFVNSKMARDRFFRLYSSDSCFKRKYHQSTIKWPSSYILSSHWTSSTSSMQVRIFLHHNNGTFQFLGCRLTCWSL